MFDRFAKSVLAAAICVALPAGVCGCSDQGADLESCPAEELETAQTSAGIEDTSAQDSKAAAVLPVPNEALAWTMGSSEPGESNGQGESNESESFLPLATGESAAAGACSLRVDEASWKTGEYWLPNEGTPCTSTSYDVEQGTALLLIRGIFENPTNVSVDVSGTVKVRAMVDGSGAYEGWADIASYYGDMVGVASPGEKGDFVAGVPVPKEAMEGFSQAEVRFEILDDAGRVQARYCLHLDETLS